LIEGSAARWRDVNDAYQGKFPSLIERARFSIIFPRSDRRAAHRMPGAISKSG
jgi:hypothetical protein